MWVCTNGVSERDCDAYLESYLTNLSLHAALTQKNISDSRVVGWCADRLNTPYSFWVMRERKVTRTK